MEPAFAILLSAAGIAFVHTVLGVDHTLPFIALARARNWSTRKTFLITGACGIAHVLASIGLGVVGIALGWGIGRMETLETGRGPIAAWVLTAFGAAYLLWGLRQGWRRKSGMHMHQHGVHMHLHLHGEADHEHGGSEKESKSTFWILFTIFVLGPCEPLIPLFILPASQGDWTLAVAAAIAFGLVTVATMLAVVGLALRGARHLRLAPLERWAEAVAGGVVTASGLAVLFLGI